METFSIVVPVYNVEKYLSECINSVISQSFQDYELILVDDGSPDKCPEICDEYAKTNSKIKVIHKENGGLPDARNAGIKEASGKYLLFLDSDDYLNEESLKKLSECIESVGEVDILLCSMLYYSPEDDLVYKDLKEYTEQFKKGITGIEVLAELVKADTIVWNAFTSVFRRDNLIKNNIYFDKNFTGAEDLDFFMNVILHSNYFAAENIDICVYRLRREGSITTNLNIKALYVQLFVMKKWFDYFYNINNDYQNKHILCSFFSSRYIQKIFGITQFGKAERHGIIDFINKNSYILNYPTCTKYRILGKAYKIFGPEIGTSIQKIYHKLFSKRTDIIQKV